MISVLTLTYQRHHLLEEAMESFLRQEFDGKAEMVIINDSGLVTYRYDHEMVRVINLNQRFSSIGEKLKFGFSQCQYPYIYRLDDDDLLAPDALKHVWEDIQQHPGYDIYRSNGHYFFENNQFRGISGSVNNGNVYTKDYLAHIDIPSTSFGEDEEITYGHGARIYESERIEKTMIYRWGMNTYHISGMGDIGNLQICNQTDQIAQTSPDQPLHSFERGMIRLRPHFNEEYHQQIPK